MAQNQCRYRALRKAALFWETYRPIGVFEKNTTRVCSFCDKRCGTSEMLGRACFQRTGDSRMMGPLPR